MKSEEIMRSIRENRLSKVYRYLHKGYPPIKSWVLSHGGTKEDAQDVFQEALVVFCTNCRKENFQLTAAISTYLFAVARNTWVNILRKRGKALVPDGYDTEEGDYQQREERFVLAEEAFGLLGRKCQELLSEFYLKRKSFKEISRRLGLANERVAKNQKYRCLSKARDLYVSLLEKGGIRW